MNTTRFLLCVILALLVSGCANPVLRSELGAAGFKEAGAASSMGWTQGLALLAEFPGESGLSRRVDVELPKQK